MWIKIMSLFVIFLLSPLVGAPFMALPSFASVAESNLLRSDVNGDGVVNILDIGIVAGALGSYPGHTKWNVRADLNNDDVVNILDMLLVALDFGNKWLSYDFDEPLNLNVVSGTWSTMNGLLEGSSNAQGLVYTRDNVGKTFTLTAKVKIAPDSPNAEAAFCFCLADSGNFYWAGLGCWGHRVSISRTVGYVSQELVFNGDRADVVKDVWYIVSIKVSGNTITLYVNDVLGLVINDSSLSSGAIGIRTWNSHILVDYITVSGQVSTTENATPPPTPLSAAMGIGEEWTLGAEPGDASDVLARWNVLLDKASKWHFNTVRLAFRFPDSPSTPYTVVPTLDYNTLDQLLNLLDSRGLKAIADLHNYYDMEGYFGSDSWIQHWVAFAQRYRGDKRILAYELFNEVYSENWDSTKVETYADVPRALAKCTDAIRQIDSNRIVVWTPAYFYDGEIPPDAIRENVIYSEHAWTWSPATEGDVQEGISQAEYLINRSEEFIETYNVKPANFWIGEFGLRSEGYEASGQFCLRIIDWCVKNNIGFNLWLYSSSHHIDDETTYDNLLMDSTYGGT